jgi:hypothetical protein
MGLNVFIPLVLSLLDSLISGSTISGCLSRLQVNASSGIIPFFVKNCSSCRRLGRGNLVYIRMSSLDGHKMASSGGFCLPKECSMLPGRL